MPLGHQASPSNMSFSSFSPCSVNSGSPMWSAEAAEGLCHSWALRTDLQLQHCRVPAGQEEQEFCLRRLYLRQRCQVRHEGRARGHRHYQCGQRGWAEDRGHPEQRPLPGELALHHWRGGHALFHQARAVGGRPVHPGPQRREEDPGERRECDGLPDQHSAKWKD